MDNQRAKRKIEFFMKRYFYTAIFLLFVIMVELLLLLVRNWQP